MRTTWKSPPSICEMRRAPERQAQAFRYFSKFSSFRHDSQGSHLNEPLRRLAWLRQELDLWNTAEGQRPMPQPSDFGLDLPNLRPSEVHWWRAA